MEIRHHVNVQDGFYSTSFFVTPLDYQSDQNTLIEHSPALKPLIEHILLGTALNTCELMDCHSWYKLGIYTS